MADFGPLNDHVFARKPSVHSEKKQDLEVFAFGLMESDLDLPIRADETNRNFWAYRQCQRTVALSALPGSVNNLGERQWGRMTTIRLTCSRVPAAEVADTIGDSSSHRVALSPTSSPQVA